MTVINNFYNEWSFLSNFAHSEITYNQIRYPTVEHAYQAAKANKLSDALRIARAKTAGQAKKLGRIVGMRPDWEDVKDDVMLDLLRLKFEDPWMREHLLETGDTLLIEGNTWHDNYWGDCSCVKCSAIEGKNRLGRLLMQVRDEISASA